MTDTSPLIVTFLDLVAARRLDEAAELALRQVDAGDRPQDVIRTLLAAAQAEAGERWHRGTWSVAQEHQATAVVDTALHRVVTAVRPRATRALLAVVCAEGDQHTMPSRMAAELLRLDGWRVLFLGGWLPAPELAPWLLDARPDAVVVTCSMPTFARGVHTVVAAATRIGIPVVAGGRGMGLDARRAASLGAGWAPDLGVLHTALGAPAPPVDHEQRRTRVAASSHAALRRDGIIDAAMWELGRLWPTMHALNARQLALTAESSGELFDVVTAATLLDDTRVLTEFVQWLTLHLAARGLPPELVPLCLRALVAAIPPQLDSVYTALAVGVHGAPTG